MANQIVVKGDFRVEEGLASGTILPGMLLEVTSATAHTVKAHATQEGYAERIVAIEDALQGNTVDDSYASGALVQYAVCNPGCEVYMLVEALSSAISIGEVLMSNGAGYLQSYADGSTSTLLSIPIAIALAEQTPATAPALLKVRLL